MAGCRCLIRERPACHGQVALCARVFFPSAVSCQKLAAGSVYASLRTGSRAPSGCAGAGRAYGTPTKHRPRLRVPRSQQYARFLRHSVNGKRRRLAASARYEVNLLFTKRKIEIDQQRHFTAEYPLRIRHVRFDMEIDIVTAFAVICAGSEHANCGVCAEVSAHRVAYFLRFAFGQAHGGWVTGLCGLVARRRSRVTRCALHPGYGECVPRPWMLACAGMARDRSVARGNHANVNSPLGAGTGRPRLSAVSIHSSMTVSSADRAS